jgi:hypothetical protein
MRKSYSLSLLLLLILVGFYFYSRSKPAVLNSAPKINSPIPSQISQLTPNSSASQSGVLGVQTKTSGCLTENGLPDPQCSPGAIFPNVTKDQVCTPGYSSSVRNVSQSTKNKVFEEYGLPPTGHQPGEFEVDHIISLELGGSNDISNLWPEAAEPRPGYHEKDRVENYLHDQICSGVIRLEQAQQKISSNWLDIYNQLQNP